MLKLIKSEFCPKLVVTCKTIYQIKTEITLYISFPTAFNM